MKKMSAEIIKELVISILIVICVVLIISVIFYDKISLSKVIPQSEEYQLSEEMQADIDNGILEETKEMVINYYIDAADLKKYERTKEYNKGKINPFAAESTNATSNSTTTDNNQTTNNESSNSSNNDNYYYEDDGTK